MSDLYEFTVEWPSTTAKSVIVTGDFDKWSKSLPLSRSTGSDVFTTTIKVPYGCPTRYKFIVDGEWTVKPGQPTEYSPEGYLNNVHYVPLKAPPVVQPPTSEKAESENGTAGQSFGITDWRDTIVASAGTSGALEYVASGIGETMRSVVGVDPFNSNQVAIPTPITPSPSTGLPSPAANSTGDIATANPKSTTDEPSATSSGSASVAPLIPIKIVPVYAKENCTIDPSKVLSNEESIGTFVGVRPPPRDNVQEEVKKEDEETAKARQDAPTSPPGIVVTEPARPVEVRATAEAPKEEEKPVVEAAALAGDVNSSPAAEPASNAVSETAVEEKAPAVDKSSEKVDGTTAIPASSPAPEAPAVSTTNGHAQDPSSASTKVASSSRPTTPAATPAPAESVTSTPASTVRKSKVFPQLGRGSPSKASKGGNTFESSAKDGKGTIGKKKRTSSFFDNLKKLFHHEHHEKDKEKKKSQ
ncbi:hypothetical protein D9756_000764 [Leucocoprinus leucothites]|uniref:AMP-activated protein kinase glycogen-binding domain-containing protein n=1 Tax=Leucocoprinus leucothites TaxID=201217 RepID=A0A8H5GEW2_9AGAR|nr:hypothetical protein D9756_000764 [Leucoagaricus leucothites]